MDLTFTPWIDPLNEYRSYPADSIYVRLFWLPLLGPTATLLFEAFNFDFTTEPFGFTQEADEISCSLGFDLGFGRHSQLRQGIECCINLGLITQVGRAHYAVRTFAPPLSDDQLSQLTPSLQELHGAYRSDATFDSK